MSQRSLGNPKVIFAGPSRSEKDVSCSRIHRKEFRVKRSMMNRAKHESVPRVVTTILLFWTEMRRI
jgi:hypothetical protein